MAASKKSAPDIGRDVLLYDPSVRVNPFVDANAGMSGVDVNLLP